MTVSSSTRKAGPLNCNGAVTAYPFAFKCFTSADIRVVLTNSSAVESDLVLDSNYTVSLNADQNASPGGTITTTVAYATGNTITIVSDLDMLQETDIQNQGGFYPEVIENALDKVTMLVQQVQEQVDRAVKVDVSSEVDPEDYLTQASAAATSAAASASAAGASATSASGSAASVAGAAANIVGFEWVGSWLTATAYIKNNIVYESGNSYIALSDHTSGTFSTDYSNGLWEIFAAKGAAGAGAGDMLAANNLSEVTPATARANLSAAKSGANSDITSIAGLTTPLSVAQGGIGAATLTLNNLLLGNGTSAPQEVAPGASGNVLTSDGTTWASEAPAAAGITLGTPQATTSGTTKDFSSLPAGIKQFTVTLSSVSFTSAVAVGFRLGTGGTPQTTGYTNSYAAISSTANTTSGGSSTSGILFPPLSTSGGSYDGQITFTLQDASTNTWTAHGTVASGGASNIGIASGSVSLSGVLNIVSIYGGTFDAGKVNIAYSL
jgi:hypothetical protein